MISDAGEALLADLGLSTTIEKLDTDPTTATFIRNHVSVAFAAPEILFGDPSDSTGRLRSKTVASDVYAFGMLVLQVRGIDIRDLMMTC